MTVLGECELVVAEALHPILVGLVLSQTGLGLHHYHATHIRPKVFKL